MQWRLVERAAAEIATGFKKEKAHTPAQVSVQRTDANLGHRAHAIVDEEDLGGKAVDCGSAELSVNLGLTRGHGSLLLEPIIRPGRGETEWVRHSSPIRCHNAR